MTIIVNTGTTLTASLGSGVTLTTDGTVALGGLLDGAGTISGAFLPLTNLGTIEADGGGSALTINTGSLTNQGTIEALIANLTIAPGVKFTNFSNGTLTGGQLDAFGTGTLTVSSGAITTDNGTIVLDGTSSAIVGPASAGSPTIDSSLVTVGTAGLLYLYDNRNFLASHSLVVSGALALGGGILAAGGTGITVTATGQIQGYGTINPGTPVTDAGVITALGGTLSLPQPGQISGQGTFQVSAGATLELNASGADYSQTINNGGTVAITTNAFAPAPITISGSYTGIGSFLIEGLPQGSGTTDLVLPGSVSADVAFDSNLGELVLQTPSAFKGKITGFASGDTIALDGLSGTSAKLSGGILSVINSGATVDTLVLDTTKIDYSAATFTIANNINNTVATLTVSGTQQVPCYVEGTRIATLSGETPVEKLRPGDIVRTHFAGTTPIVWIGHRHVDCLRHPAPHNILPILVEAHAFGPRMPHRDLYLSPDHAVYVDDVLIPIRNLVNRKTIRQVKVERVTYFHIELAEHDILMAEGLTAESYLENGDRTSFDNGGTTIMLHPEFGARRWETAGCAPLVVTGPALKAVKDRLDRRADNPRATGRRRRRTAA